MTFNLQHTFEDALYDEDSAGKVKLISLRQRIPLRIELPKNMHLLFKGSLIRTSGALKAVSISEAEFLLNQFSSLVAFQSKPGMLQRKYYLF